MDWKKIIQDLMDGGLSQGEIATKCNTGQSYVSGLLRGSKKRPSWLLGNSLIELHRQKFGNGNAPVNFRND